MDSVQQQVIIETPAQPKPPRLTLELVVEDHSPLPSVRTPTSNTVFNDVEEAATQRKSSNYATVATFLKSKSNSALLKAVKELHDDDKRTLSQRVVGLAERLFSIRNILLIVFFLNVLIGVISTAVLLGTNGQEVMSNSATLHLRDIFISTNLTLFDYIEDTEVVTNSIVEVLHATTITFDSLKRPITPFFSNPVNFNLWAKQLYNLRTVNNDKISDEVLFVATNGNFVIITRDNQAIIRNDTFSDTLHRYVLNATTLEYAYNSSFQPSLANVNLTSQPWYQKTRQKKAFTLTTLDTSPNGDRLLSSLLTYPSFTAAQPIYATQHNTPDDALLYGIVAIKSSLYHFSQWLNATASPEKFNLGAHYAILNSAGYLIASSKSMYDSLNYTSALSFPPMEGLECKFPFIREVTRYLQTQNVLLRADGRYVPQANQLFSMTNEDGSYNVRYSSICDPSTTSSNNDDDDNNNGSCLDWFLIVGLRTQGFLDSLFKSPVPTILTVLCIVFGAAFVTFATTIATRPLYKISSQIYEMAKLDFSSEDASSKNKNSNSSTTMQQKSKIKTILGEKCLALTRYSPLYEIRTMQKSIVTLQRGLDSFKKYVPALLVRKIMNEKKNIGLGLNKMNITTFFFDVQDFTTISENTPIEHLVEALSLFFTETTRIVEKNHGTIDKFIGDSIMAIWNVDYDPVANHEFYACKAAIECIEKVNELCTNPDWIAKKYPVFKIRVGINSGEALVGNVGSPDRYNFTAIGENVNLASRLESLNKQFDTLIIISELTFNGVKDILLCEFIGYVGIQAATAYEPFADDEMVAVFCIIGPRSKATSDQIICADLLYQAHLLFLQKKYKEVESVLLHVLERKEAYNMNCNHINLFIKHVQFLLTRDNKYNVIITNHEDETNIQEEYEAIQTYKFP